MDECDVDELPQETAIGDSVVVTNLEHQLKNALRVRICFVQFPT